MLSERGAPAPRRSSYVAYTLQDSQSRRARIDASPMNPREEVDAAAARIQSQARRRKDSARAESQRRQEEEEAASATRIQARVRGRRAERAVYEHKQLRHEAAGYDALLCEAAEKEQAALRLQAHARGRHTRATLSPGSEPRRVRLSPGSEISRAEAAAKEAAEAAAATELAVERAVECAVERELLRLAILKLGDGASLTMEELLATRAALAKYGSLDDAMMAAEAATEAAEAAADAANAAAVAAASRFEEPSWSEAWVDASPALTGSAPSGSAPGSSAPGGSPKANESGGGATGGNGTSLQLTPEARALQARIDSGHPLSTQELRRIRYDLTALDSGGGSGGGGVSGGGGRGRGDGDGEDEDFGAPRSARRGLSWADDDQALSEALAEEQEEAWREAARREEMESAAELIQKRARQRSGRPEPRVLGTIREDEGRHQPRVLGTIREDEATEDAPWAAAEVAAERVAHYRTLMARMQQEAEYMELEAFYKEAMAHMQQEAKQLPVELEDNLEGNLEAELEGELEDNLEAELEAFYKEAMARLRSEGARGPTHHQTAAETREGETALVRHNRAELSRTQQQQQQQDEVESSGAEGEAALVQQYRAELSRMQQEQNEVDSLRAELSRMQQEQNEVDSLRAELSRMQQEQNEVDSLRAELSRMQQEQNEVDSLRAELSRMQQEQNEVDSLRAELSRMQQEQNEVDSLRAELSRMQQEPTAYEYDAAANIIQRRYKQRAANEMESRQLADLESRYYRAANEPRPLAEMEPRQLAEMEPRQLAEMEPRQLAEMEALLQKQVEAEVAALEAEVACNSSDTIEYTKMMRRVRAAVDGQWSAALRIQKFGRKLCRRAIERRRRVDEEVAKALRLASQRTLDESMQLLEDAMAPMYPNSLPGRARPSTSSVVTGTAHAALLTAEPTSPWLTTLGTSPPMVARYAVMANPTHVADAPGAVPSAPSSPSRQRTEMAPEMARVLAEVDLAAELVDRLAHRKAAGDGACPSFPSSTSPGYLGSLPLSYKSTAAPAAAAGAELGGDWGRLGAELGGDWGRLGAELGGDWLYALPPSCGPLPPSSHPPSWASPSQPPSALMPPTLAALLVSYGMPSAHPAPAPAPHAQPAPLPPPAAAHCTTGTRGAPSAPFASTVYGYPPAASSPTSLAAPPHGATTVAAEAAAASAQSSTPPQQPPPQQPLPQQPLLPPPPPRTRRPQSALAAAQSTREAAAAPSSAQYGIVAPLRAQDGGVAPLRAQYGARPDGPPDTAYEPRTERRTERHRADTAYEPRTERRTERHRADTAYEPRTERRTERHRDAAYGRADARREAWAECSGAAASGPFTAASGLFTAIGAPLAGGLAARSSAVMSAVMGMGGALGSGRQLLPPLDLAAASTPEPNESFAHAARTFQQRVARADWQPLTAHGAALRSAVRVGGMLGPYA